jgi:aryl-alcohol dehydrogenase-like predicted oxidoreductase
MDTNRLGHSGLRVPALSFGTGTFGGGNDFFKAWGTTDAGGASRLIDVCLDHGVSLFDSADVYSAGLAEKILGEAIKGKRNRVLISTKATFPLGDGPNDYGSSRQHLLESTEGSLKRLGIETIDLLQLHGQDYNTPVEETLSTLDQLVRSGKVRYIGCSNFSGWHLMKSLSASDRYGYPRYVAHQASSPEKSGADSRRRPAPVRTPFPKPGRATTRSACSRSLMRSTPSPRKRARRFRRSR